VSHQNNICLRLFTYPNKVTIRLIAKLASQLLFEIHFYLLFDHLLSENYCLVTNCTHVDTGCLPQNEVNVGICCHPHLFYNSCAQHLKINDLESQYPIDI
jgi:hypothetical protein